MRQGAHTGRDQTAADNHRRDAPHHIAFFMISLGGGGVERVVFNLAQAYVDRGSRVDLVVCQAEGPYLDQVPEGVKVIGLKAGPAGWLARAYILAADPQGV